MRASATKAKAGSKKDGKEGKERVSEDSFENNRYYIKRLEQRDPKLFKYKSGESYARKCQASNNMQPLVVTRDELTNINEAFKKYNPDHKDLYAIEKSGSEVALEGFRIDGRDPNLIYICPDYWDRKNQMILDPRLTLQEDHPIDGVPMEEIVYSKKNREDSRYVLRRNNGKYQLRFIQNVHPDGYALPCCNLRPTDYKIDSKVYVKEQGSWVVGVIRGLRDSEGNYDVSIGSENKKVHISRIDKYRQDGSSNALNQGFPLLEGSYGYAPDILKSNFWMDPSYPNLSQIDSFGWMRLGIVRDKDSFLRSFHVQLNQHQQFKRSFDDFKRAIIDDLMQDDFPIKMIDGGRFIQYFRSSGFFLSDQYSLPEFLGKEITLDEVDALDIKTKDKMISDFAMKSSKENFKRYLEDEDEHDIQRIAPLLYSLSRYKGKTFQKKYELTILIYRDINETIEVMRWGDLQAKGYAASFYLKDEMCEPLYFYLRGIIYPWIRDAMQKISLKEGVMILYEDNVAQIKSIQNDVISASILQSDDVVELPRSQCLALNAQIIYNKIRDITHIKDIPESPMEIPPLSHILEILPQYNQKYRTKFAIEFIYRDHSQKFSHIMLYDQSDPIILPIKPTSQNYDIKSRDILRLPKISYNLQIDQLEKWDRLENELGHSTQYANYLDNLRLLLNKRDKITHLLLNCGALLKIAPIAYSPSYPYPTLINDAIIDLSYHNLTGEEQNEKIVAIEDSHKIKADLYQTFSKYYIILQDKDRYREIDHIRYHPMMMGISKRIKIREILEKYINITINDSQVKQFIEILCNNSPSEVEALLIHPPLTLADVKKSSVHDYIFTQRQIYNRDHEDIFRYHSLFLRNITTYDHYQIEKKKRNHTNLDADILVSYYTKYPNILHKLFPSFQLYQHIGGDQPITYASIISYAINYPGFNEKRVRELVIDFYRSDLSQDLLQNYNQHQKPDDEIDASDQIIEAISDPHYRFQLTDLKLLSYASIHSFHKPFGIVIFTNRYSDPNRPHNFTLQFAIHEDCFTSDQAIDDLPILCFYEDANVEGSVISLKNFIFSDEARSSSLKQLREKPSFERAYKKYIKSLKI